MEKFKTIVSGVIIISSVLSILAFKIKNGASGTFYCNLGVTEPGPCHDLVTKYTIVNPSSGNLALCSDGIGGTFCEQPKNVEVDRR